MPHWTPQWPPRAEEQGKPGLGSKLTVQAARIPTVQMGKLRPPVWGLFVQKVLALLSASDASPAPRTLPTLLLPLALGTQGTESRAPGLDSTPGCGTSKGLYPLPPRSPLLWFPRREMRQRQASEHGGQNSSVPALMPPRQGEVCCLVPDPPGTASGQELLKEEADRLQGVRGGF